MQRFAPVLIAVLAAVALVTAAGSFGAVDGGLSVDGGDSVGEGTVPSGGGGAGGAGNRTANGTAVSGTITPTDAPSDDDEGLSWLFGVLLVGGVVGALVVLVVLTDDDERAPPADGEAGDEPEGPTGPPVDPSYGSPEDNAVVRAWRRLSERAEGTDESATPGETADAAVDRGLPTEAVTVLTEQFRAVRYGRERANAERERRAERLADRIRGSDDRQETGDDPDRRHEGGDAA